MTHSFKYRGRIYDYIALDRMTGEIVGRSDDYIKLAKKWPETRYEIKSRHDW